MSSQNLKVQTTGSSKNPALVFLHAFPFNASMWQEQVKLFSEKFYCLAVDFPGFGQSSLPSHAFTLEYYVDEVLSSLKAEKINSAIFCGLSMGGYVALRLQEKAPEVCRALILCDTKAGADGNEAKLKRWANIQGSQKNSEEFLEAQWTAMSSQKSKGNAALKQELKALMSMASLESIAAGLVALATRTDTSEGLGEIRCPTLILVGQEDQVTPPKEAELLHQAIPQSQLKVIPDAGHISNLENPQKFNDAVSQFLLALP